MKSLLEKVRRLLACEDGPTAVEYAVILSRIVVVCLTAIMTIGTHANSSFTKIGSSIPSGQQQATSPTSPTSPTGPSAIGGTH
jgi:pilus assembly protein Flp/PilA